MHSVKFACLYSVNPFSTIVSVNILHYIHFFCMCPTYLTAGLAFRFPSKSISFSYHFQGKWPLAPSSFEQMSFSHRFIQICLATMNQAKPYQQIISSFLLTWFGMVALSLHDVHVRLANKSEKDHLKLSWLMMICVETYNQLSCNISSVHISPPYIFHRWPGQLHSASIWQRMKWINTVRILLAVFLLLCLATSSEGQPVKNKNQKPVRKGK